jgi:hypothetical protein
LLSYFLKIGYSDKLKKIQLDAARIVTGLPIFTKSEYLYAETGWETLSERRYRRKLQLFFNIKCGMAPEYLRHLVPPTIQSTTIYRNLDNESNFLIAMSSLFHSLTVEGINDELVIESTERNY